MNQKKAQNFIRTMVVFACIGTGILALYFGGNLVVALGNTYSDYREQAFLGGLAGLISIVVLGIAVMTWMVDWWWP